MIINIARLQDCALSQWYVIESVSPAVPPKLRLLFILSTLSVAISILLPTSSLRYLLALFITHGFA